MKKPVLKPRSSLFIFTAIAFFLVSLASYAAMPSDPQTAGFSNTVTKNESDVITGVKTAKLSEPDAVAKAKVDEAYGKLPLSFEENRGQLDKEVKFLARGIGYSLFLTSTEAVLSLSKPSAKPDKQGKPDALLPKDKEPAEAVAPPEVVRLKLIGANPEPKVSGAEKLPGKVNYFIGNDSKKWRTNVPTYKAVDYKDVYKGIDLRYYGNNRQLEYDIIVHPGADPSIVKFEYEGIEGLKVTDDGRLEIILKEGKLVQKRPFIYQLIDGKKVEVAGKFEIQSAKEKAKDVGKKFAYGFKVASYNENYQLIIDPTLSYSTYLGGNFYDLGYSIAVDISGNAYVTGFTYSTNFPTASPIQGSNADGVNSDAFVTKIDASGSFLVYSTYLGGSGSDQGSGIAVDSSGNAYVTGYTQSTNFPTSSPIQGSIGGYVDAFVTKIDASGSSLVYSTYLGGTNYDEGSGIAVDSSGNAYVTGRTGSTNFPTSSPIQGSMAGQYDVFITKIDASGSSLAYSTYLGGNWYDEGRDIAVDGFGNAYVTGNTGSTNFPTVSPIQGSKAGGYYDIFITKIDASGSSLAYSTYLGGSATDISFGIAVDGSGNAYVTGYTQSTNFPTSSPIQGSNAGYWDAFVTKVNASGNSLVYSTYLGGSATYDAGYGIAVDSSGNAYVTGSTLSNDFPTSSPIQGSRAGYLDIFVTKVNASGNSLVYSTYLGGSGSEYSYGIAVDISGNAYVTGFTYSTNFPTASPIQGSKADNADAFVAKIVGGASNQPPVADAGLDQILECTGAGGANATLNGSGSSDPDGDSLTYSWVGSFGTASGVSTAQFFSLGTDTVTLTVDDGNGETANDTVDIAVQDTTPPSVNAGADVTVEATGPGGASYDVSGQASVSDLCSGTTYTNVSPAGVYPIGSTTVTVTATDGTGNSASDAVVVTVVDTTPPVVTAPADITLVLPVTPLDIGTAAATDAVGVVSLTSDAPASFPVGTTVVTWTAKDAADNVGTATQNVSVVYNFGGFQTPLTHDKPFKLNRTVPIKFQLTDATGNYVSTATATLSLQQYSSGEPSGDPIDGEASGNSDSGNTFRYDSVNEQYIFNLSTKGMSQGTWLITVSLDDGTVQTYFMSLKK